MLTPYQFASNTPIQAIDLDGLEAKIIVHEIGSNSIMNYTVDLNDPKANRNNILYADKEKYGTRGDLTVIKKVGSDDIIKIFEISNLDWLKNKWDQLTDDTYTGGTQGSGMNLTSREGAGQMESRDIPLDGAKSVEISALLTYANLTKFMNLPTSTIADLLNNPEQIADITDVLTDAFGEYQELPMNNKEIKNNQETEVDHLINVPDLTRNGKDTFILPDGSGVERSFKKIDEKRSESGKRPLKNKKDE